LPPYYNKTIDNGEMILSYNENAYREFLNSEPLAKEVNYKKEADYKRQRMQKCPICGVFESYITNVHCVTHHNMKKSEVEAVYGKITTGGWMTNG